MDQELKTKWLEALRSGDFKQGASALSKNGKHCCLGVLCEIAGRDDDWREWSFMPFSEGGAYGVSEQEARTLSTMNDKGSTFIDIANYIEARL